MHCKEWLFLFSNQPQSYHRISLWAHGEKLYYVQWLIMARRLIPLRHAARCCPGSLKENGKVHLCQRAAHLTSQTPQVSLSRRPSYRIMLQNMDVWGWVTHQGPSERLTSLCVNVCMCVWGEVRIHPWLWLFLAISGSSGSSHTHWHAIFLASTCCLWACWTNFGSPPSRLPLPHPY